MSVFSNDYVSTKAFGPLRGHSHLRFAHIHLFIQPDIALDRQKTFCSVSLSRINTFCAVFSLM